MTSMQPKKQYANQVAEADQYDEDYIPTPGGKGGEFF